MGIRTSRKKKRIYHVATCRSTLQAMRLRNAARDDITVVRATLSETSVTIVRIYYVVGNHNDDIDRWQHAIVKKADVHCDWATPRVDNVDEHARPYVEIRNAVAKSRESVPQISGSRAFPAAPIKAQLRAEGFVVR